MVERPSPGDLEKMEDHVKKYLLLSLAFLMLTVLAAAPVTAEEAKMEGPPYTVGMMAKGVVAKDAGGQDLDLLTVGEKGKKVIMFSNTACSACKEALRVIQGVVPGKADLIVVATDFGPFERIAAYKESNNFGGTWVQDADFALPTMFDFGFTPAVVVLEKGGKVLYTHGGYNKRRAADFEKELAAAVN